MHRVPLVDVVVMSETTKFLVRKVGGDLVADSEQALLQYFLQGQCKSGDFVYSFSLKSWSRVADFPSVKALFQAKPGLALDRKLIYVLDPPSLSAPLGPFSLKEMQQKIQACEHSDQSWVFVDGDKEWRQISGVKALREMLPALPADIPSLPAEGVFTPDEGTSPSLLLDGTETPAAVSPAAPPGAAPDASVTREEPSIALDLNEAGISLEPPAASSAPPPFKPPSSAPAPEAPPPFNPAALTPMPAAVAAAAPQADAEIEEPTKAVSALGLSLSDAPMPELKKAPPVAPPPKPASPPKPAPVTPRAPVDAPKKSPEKDTGSFDGITAEIPTDPIWLVKPNNSEMVSGPFRFLEVVKYLEEGKITKNDKISKAGTKSFIKISQQYEFNVKFSVETVVENGVEKQKIFIRRRHPRIPYLANVQVVGKTGLVAASCVNISAGGILMEAPKADFNLGDILEIKILPAVIKQPIACKALVIGRIPKIPPGYALKFEDLKQTDKEAIEFFVQETMKREMQKT